MEHLINDEKKSVLTDVGLLLMRLWAGLVMVVAHGWPKVQEFGERAEGWDGMFFGMPGSLAVGLAILAEVVFALMVTIGVATRAAAVGLVVNMSVAAYAHFVLWGDDFGDTELALMFLSIFLLLAFTGPGRFSVDNVISDKLGDGHS